MVSRNSYGIRDFWSSFLVLLHLCRKLFITVESLFTFSCNKVAAIPLTALFEKTIMSRSKRTHTINRVRMDKLENYRSFYFICVFCKTQNVLRNEEKSSSTKRVNTTCMRSCFGYATEGKFLL